MQHIRNVSNWILLEWKQEERNKSHFCQYIFVNSLCDTACNLKQNIHVNECHVEACLKIGSFCWQVIVTKTK